MSQIALTSSQRVAALGRFGYTEAEAYFLCLAALHSGYFLRRQYAQFLSGKDGGKVSQLIQRLLANAHVKTSTWRQNTQLYHLCTRPFYEALGQGENRHRRARALLAIKNKIMGLDFVLAHRNFHYLATEQEKFNYFTETLKKDAYILPAKLYRSANSGVTTTRYFVEKYPIYLTGPAGADSPPVVAFCFVDEGAASLSAFETFLEHYGPLFLALPEFRVNYVADRNTHFKPATQMFGRFLGRAQSPALDPLIRRRLEHFEMRRLYEAKELASFDRVKPLERTPLGISAPGSMSSKTENWTARGKRSRWGPSIRWASARPPLRRTRSWPPSIGPTTWSSHKRNLESFWIDTFAATLTVRASWRRALAPSI